MSNQLALSRPIGNQGMYQFFGYSEQRATPSNLDPFFLRIQFQRLASDLSDLAKAYSEAEYGYFPYRVKLMRIYQNVVENPSFKPLLDRAKELTTQRDKYVYQIKAGKKVRSDDLSAQLNAQWWLDDYIECVVDAVHFGYNLINLGDIDLTNPNNPFPKLSFTRRENIRPDGINESGAIVASMPYILDGIHIQENSREPLIPLCNHWISTKSQKGISKVGYGLLANLAKLEINHRHIEEWQVDYIENYGTPITKGSTKKQGDKRRVFERFLENSGANRWILLDPATEDKVEYEMPPSAGTGWKVFSQAKKEIEQAASQLILGHSDAIVSMPGKLGGAQSANKDGFNESLIEQAMNAKQLWYGNYLTRKMNEVCAPKMRELGDVVGSRLISGLFPEGYYFGLANDKEEQEVIRRTNSACVMFSTFTKNMYDSGLQPEKAEMVDSWTQQLGLVDMKWIKVEPKKELDEKRDSKTEIKKDDPGSATPDLIK